MTIKQVAKILGVTTSTIYRKIRRNGDFSRSEIQKLISAIPMNNPMEVFFKN